MPEVEAELDAEAGKRVTITIAESATAGPLPEDDPNTFVIDNGKRRLTITIAE